MKKGDLIDLEINSIAYGGSGLGRTEDNVVAFIKYAVPGDKVRIKVKKIKKNYIEGEISKILEPSSFRVSPRCPHFLTCGGCQLQNLDYKKQLIEKEKQVKDSLIRIGGLDSTLINSIVNPMMGMDYPWYYRNKMEYTFSREKNEIILGLHKSGSYYQIVDIKNCYISNPIIKNILSIAKDFATKNSLTTYDQRKKMGFLRNLAIRLGVNTNQIMINLVTNKVNLKKQDFKNLKKNFIERFYYEFSPDSLLWTISTSPASAIKPEKIEVLKGNEGIEEKLNDLVFSLSFESFFQTNTKMASTLYKIVDEYSQLKGDEVILDIYCGTGAIGLFLAKKAKRVIGIEVVEKAVQDAYKNAEINNIKNIEFICERAEICIVKIFSDNSSVDFVILDPPRAGVHPKIIGSLLKNRPPKIIYVSCNPTTLARDLALLTEGEYKLKKVQPIDMFPHTYHIETVSLLTSHT